MPASLTLANARDLARLIAQDTATTAPGVSDTKANSFIEEARQWYASMFPDDTLGLAYNESSAGVTTSLALTTSSTFRSLDTCFCTDTGTLYDKVDYYLLAQKSQKDTQTSVPASDIASWGCVRDPVVDNKWNLIFYPTAAVARKIRIYGHYEVAVLTGDSDVLLFGHHGSRVIARLAAVEIARLCGRPTDFIASIAANLPERVLTRRDDLKRMLANHAMRT